MQKNRSKGDGRLPPQKQCKPVNICNNIIKVLKEKTVNSNSITSKNESETQLK